MTVGVITLVQSTTTPRERPHEGIAETRVILESGTAVEFPFPALEDSYERAQADVEAGRVRRFANVEDLISDLNS